MLGVGGLVRARQGTQGDETREMVRGEVWKGLVMEIQVGGVDVAGLQEVDEG